jgi:amino acid adenylation domain-containing protein/FkbM family methyltransferase
MQQRASSLPEGEAKVCTVFQLAPEDAGLAAGLGRQAALPVPVVCAAALLALLRCYNGDDRPRLEHEDGQVGADLADDPGFAELLARTAAALAAGGWPAGAPRRFRLPPTPLAAAPLALCCGAGKTPEIALECAAAVPGAAVVLARLAGHFRTLLAAAAARPERPISSLPLLGVGERQALLDWNDTRVAYPSEPCLHQLIAAQAERTPAAAALSCEGEELSYGELAGRAHRLAWHLRRLGVGPEVRVGICAERSPELVVGLLAILQAGGAYVPLDPSYPAERLGFMVEDARVAVLLLGSRLAAALPERSTARRVPLDDSAAWKEESALAPPNLNHPDNLAYAIYTSGSTGRPKGAMNSHRAIVNRLLWMQDAYRLTAADSVLQKTPISFDVSVWELFWPLLAGARLVLARPGGHQDAAYLVDLIRRERITTLHFVPAMLRAFLDQPGLESLSSLRRVIASGEALPHELAQRFLGRSEAELHNLYGPTEAAVDVTAWRCERDHPAPGAGDPSTTAPIGRPIANLRILVLGRGGQPVPAEVAGELHIGGAGLARGYLGRPDLTAERFVPDPFAGAAGGGEAGARLYRTGDLARHRLDGAVEFLGRLDHQVKVRGVRIELGEIEAALERHPAVAAAVVTAPLLQTAPTAPLAQNPQTPHTPHAPQTALGGDRRLVAYVVPEARHAGPVAAWLRLRAAGELDGRTLHEMGNGMVVAHLNRGETEFLYREIFVEREYLRHGIAVAPGDCVFDVGANIGLFTLQAGGAAPGVRVYAFEPIPALHALLRLNSQAYGVDARLFDCALGARAGSAELTYYPRLSLLSGRFADAAEERLVMREFLRHQEGSAGVTLSAAEEELLLAESLRAERVTCPLRTLSEVIAAEGVERIDLLKIDVEKSEVEVLSGLSEADWEKVGQVVVEVHDDAERRAAVAGLLVRHGFAVTGEPGSQLAGTGLYTLYARRPAAAEPTAEPAADPAARFAGGAAPWSSPARLVQDLRAALRASLPEAMVPADFVLLPELPLAPNGKVDRRALPPPEPALPELGAAGQAPRTATEEALAALWRELLGRQRVSVEDNFFDLGGHSLVATQLISRVRERFGVALTLGAVFAHPTLAALAILVESERGAPRAGAAPGLSPTLRSSRTGPLPLSFSQERIWFLQQLDPSLRAYQFQATLHLSGRLDRRAFERAHGEVVRRHEIFRTTFPARDGKPVQRIHPAGEWVPGLPLVDLSGLPAERRSAAAAACLEAAFARPFAVERLPLVRWTLLRLGVAEHVWVHVEHHLVHDGWSFNRLLGELAALYAAFTAGRPSPLPELAVQFADYACWQRQWMRGEVAEAQLDFWRRTLGGRPSTLALPTDRPRPRRQSFRGRVARHELPAALAAALRTAARRERASLFMLMEAAFAALLCRYSGQEQVNVGSAVANRRWRETETMIGMIVDTVVLANDLAGDPTVGQLVARVRQVCLAAGENQDVPFDLVVEAVRPRRDLARNPLYQVSFSFHDSPLAELHFPGLEVRLTEALSNGSAKFELNVVCIPRSEQRVGRAAGAGAPHASEEGITVLWEYASALFDPPTVARMLGHFETLLAGMAESAGRRLSELELLTTAERRQLAAWNATATPLAAAPLPVHRQFAAQAARRPGALAVAGAGSALTYGELASAAGRLACRLRRLGVGSEARVAVCMERSPWMIVAVLGVLEAGGAYLPLDPAHPRERLARTLSDARPAALLTQPSLATVLAGLAGGVPVLEVDAGLLAESVEAGSREPLAPPDPLASRPAALDEARPDQLAYVIYTSGSTGVPKGVEVTHGGLANLTAWHQSVYRVTAADRASQLASPAFDASVWEVWPYLAAGASLHQPADEVRADPARLLAWLAAEAITLAFLPTPLAEAVLESVAMPPMAPLAPMPHTLGMAHMPRMAHQAGMAPMPRTPPGLVLRALLTGGDRLRRPPRGELPFELVNHYGPTEGTVVTTCTPVEPRPGPPEPPGSRESPAPPPPIGRPIANTRAVLLDFCGQPVPEGVPGEFHVGGAGLARGYLGRPDLTAASFVPDSWGEAGARLYRTGDLARRRGDGQIEFLGRLDHQVKIRGFRIELGEIEAALSAHPAVREAVVVARQPGGDESLPAGGGPGEPRLAAYVVLHGGLGELAAAAGEDGTGGDLGERETAGGEYGTGGGGLAAAAGEDGTGGGGLGPDGFVRELREHVRRRLPEPMVPADFVLLASLPLTSAGKLDRDALPAPAAVACGSQPGPGAAAPQSAVEELVAALWSEVIGVERVGRLDDFFGLGGHSLLATRMLSRLRDELAVEVPLSALFEAPALAGFAAVVEDLLLAESAAGP